jgi:hypothetical protein
MPVQWAFDASCASESPGDPEGQAARAAGGAHRDARLGGTQ